MSALRTAIGTALHLVAKQIPANGVRVKCHRARGVRIGQGVFLGYDVNVAVSGLVYAASYAGDATGIYAYANPLAGTASVTSSGDLVTLTDAAGGAYVTTGMEVFGAYASATNDGTMWVNVDNDGVTPFDPTQTYSSIGMDVSGTKYADATNNGTMYVYAYASTAIGITVSSYDAGAVNNGLTQVQVYRFPNSLCTDRGRAINQQEADFASTLTGLPKEMYEFWSRQLKPLGYKLQFQIVDFPNGVPGDVGITLKWG